jgi:hypothetical protein
VLDSIDLRGFESERRPQPSVANLKASLKFNIHNYPFLLQARVVPFIYTQAAAAFQKESLRKPALFGSSGVGLAFHLNAFAQI